MEFTVPRMGKWTDAILAFAGTIFVMEFKVGESTYRTADKEQCEDYASTTAKDAHSSRLVIRAHHAVWSMPPRSSRYGA